MADPNEPNVTIQPRTAADWEREAATLKQRIAQIAGNTGCVDCGAAQAEWASVTHGVIICSKCAGLHRSLGVRYSFVRSITMDVWQPEQVTFMELGGNANIRDFFTQRSEPYDSPIERKYRTPTAELYRQRLKARVQGTEEPETLDAELIKELEDDLAALATSQTKKVLPPATWTPDKAKSGCELCGTKFTVVNRRHHCRRCGKLVCKLCAPANNSRPIPEWNLHEPVRHCSECYKSPAVFTGQQVGKLY